MASFHGKKATVTHMFNTIPRDYIITFRYWPDKDKPEFTDHEVQQSAYDVMDAGISASMAFNSSMDVVRGKSSIIGCRPAKTSKPADLMATLLGMVSKP